jgi:hypothetical protein
MKYLATTFKYESDGDNFEGVVVLLCSGVCSDLCYICMYIYKMS